MSFEEDCTGTWLTLRIGRYQYAGVSSGSSTASAYTSEYTGYRGVSAGTSVVLGVGASRVVSVGLSAGISEALGIGGVSVEYVGASAGVGAASGVGLARFISEGASTGLSVVSGVGASRFIALGASAGVGVAEGVGIARFIGVGASVGDGAASGAGLARFIAVGASAGDATVSGIAAGLLSDDDLLDMSGLQVWFDPLNTGDITYSTPPDVSALSPRGGAITDDIAQPTAADQPAIDGTTGALLFDDHTLEYDGTVGDFNFLHDGNGMTLFYVFRYSINDGTDYVLGTSIAAGTAGLSCGINTSNRLRLYLSNGSTFIVSNANSSNDALPGTDTWCIVEVRFTEGSNLRAWVDGISAIDTAPTGSAGSGDCKAFTLGFSQPGSGDFHGQVADVIAFNRELTSQETTDIREKLADKWGITLP